MPQEQLPEVMLLNVEMPRMDGFELATTIRNDSRGRIANYHDYVADRIKAHRARQPYWHSPLVG